MTSWRTICARTWTGTARARQATLPIDAEIVAPILEANTDYLGRRLRRDRPPGRLIHDFIRRATGGRVSARRLDRFIENSGPYRLSDLLPGNRTSSPEAQGKARSSWP